MNSGMVLIIFSDVDAFLVDVQFCKVEVVTIAQALNFKDEIVRSTDVKRALAEVLEVGFQWLMNGDTSRLNYPADQKLIDWLWENEDVRRELWERMRSQSSKTSL